jgi:hypothetical protein
VGWFERKNGEVGLVREKRKTNGGLGVNAVSLDVGLEMPYSMIQR